MNPTAILALIGDLYEQVAALQQENANLRTKLDGAEANSSPYPSTSAG